MTKNEETMRLAPWAYKLPADWDKCRIDSVAEVIFSNVDKHTIDGELPVRLCNYVDVYKNDRITGAIDFMEASADYREIKRFQIERGDVLVTKDSETPDDIAISALVEEDLPGVVCGYHLAMIRPRCKRVHGPFLAWLHASKQFRAQYEANAVGVTRFGLSQYAFRSAVAPIPSRKEQEHIAAYLDVSCAALDAAVAAKRRQIETLESLRKVSITRAITGGLVSKIRKKASGESWMGDIPEHWSAKCLKRLISEPLQYGLNEAAELEDRNLPRYIRITDFDDEGTLRDETFRSLPWDVANEAMLQNNDILFARSGATVGKTFIFRKYDGEACFAGYLIRARTLSWKLDPLFLYFFTKSFAYEAWKKLIYTQATIQNISAAKYNYLMIPVPPLNEQKAIIAFIMKMNDNLNRLARIIRRQMDVLLLYRKSLIHECVIGQRRITEADVARITKGKSESKGQHGDC